MDVRRSARCSRCNKDYPFEKVRYLPDRKLACHACLGILEQAKKEERAREMHPIDLQCLHCHYQFRRAFDKIPKACPSCGERRIVKFEKDRLTSKTLLRMADDPRLEELERW